MDDACGKCRVISTTDSWAYKGMDTGKALEKEKS